MMKPAIAFVLFTASLCLAEQLATTDDGKRVILKDDGTWTYAESAAVGSKATDGEYRNSNSIIAEQCKKAWPDNFKMEFYCRDQQKAGVEKLKRGKPKDIAEADYNTIHKKCAKEWSDNYKMREYCESEQFEAWRKLDLIRRKKQQE